MHGESLVIRILDTSAARRRLRRAGPRPGRRAAAEAAARGAARHAARHRPDRQRQDDDALRGAARSSTRSRDKLISIEDPVEYQIDGVTQIQVRPDIDLDFARVLRSVVRHDPDIIMVGETRDPETADIAVHAALTGHLLLTTLHTNSAAGAVARLLDMGVEPYLLASVLRGVVGQRLVGILCPPARRRTPRPPEERRLLRAGPASSRRPPSAALPAGRLRGVRGHRLRRPRRDLRVPRDRRGRPRADPRPRASTQAIQAAAVEAGMRTMSADGLQKCLAGITTLEEVLPRDARTEGQSRCRPSPIGR